MAAAIATALSSAGPLHAANADGLVAEPGHATTIEAFSTPTVTGTLSLPAVRGATPLPVVVLAHDATGPDTRGDRYVEQLLGAGIAVLDPLSEEDDPAAMLPRAAVALAADPRFDRTRMGVLGFGAGGAAALAGAPFAARALLYPGCASLNATVSGPVLLLHGDADPANPPAACAAAARAMTGRGAAVRRIEYPGAGYAWDRPAYGAETVSLLPAPGQSGRIAARPWPELTAMAATQVAGFFALSLRGPGR